MLKTRTMTRNIIHVSFNVVASNLMKFQWKFRPFSRNFVVVSAFCSYYVLDNVNQRRSGIFAKRQDGWMDELGFYVPSTVFQSFRDDGRVNMKGSVQ